MNEAWAVVYVSHAGSGWNVRFCADEDGVINTLKILPSICAECVWIGKMRKASPDDNSTATREMGYYQHYVARLRSGMMTDEEFKRVMGW